MFCKVYIQCGIIIQRVVTIHGVPSVRLSRSMNLKIVFAKKKCLRTIWSTEMNPIAWTYPAREHYKNAYFLWLYNLTPTLFMTNFLNHNFDARLQKTCDATVHDIPLHWYKLNWPITCDLPQSWTVLSGAFLFLSGIGFPKVISWTEQWNNGFWSLFIYGPRREETCLRLFFLTTQAQTSLHIRAVWSWTEQWNNGFWSIFIYGPRREKTCLRFFNNTVTDQPAHTRSLISAYVVHFLESFICKLATGKISVSVAEETGLKPILSETPKTGFRKTMPKLLLFYCSKI